VPIELRDGTRRTCLVALAFPTRRSTLGQLPEYHEMLRRTRGGAQVQSTHADHQLDARRGPGQGTSVAPRQVKKPIQNPPLPTSILPVNS